VHTSGNELSSIKAVVFDYGQVLCLPQQPADLAEMAAFCCLSFEVFEPLYWRDRLIYDRGDVTGEAFWNEVIKPRTFTQAQLGKLFAIDSESWGRPNPPVLDWVRQLRSAGLRLAVLSNMPLELSKHLVATRDWLALFDHLVFSWDIRSVKPEPLIYESCLKKLQIPAEQVLFLDDRPENVAGAQKLGIHAFVFESFESVLAAIKGQFDLPVPDLDAESIISVERPSL
jgi:putative hydrolase of the HAD superfamily